MARRIAVALLVALVAFALAGCAAGRWLAGAPTPGTAPIAAHAHSKPLPASGASLLARRCANCHEVPDPHAMSAAAWLGSLDRMKLRMRLPDAEWDSLAALAKR